MIGSSESDVEIVPHQQQVLVEVLDERQTTLGRIDGEAEGHLAAVPPWGSEPSS